MMRRYNEFDAEIIFKYIYPKNRLEKFICRLLTAISFFLRLR